MTYYIIQNFLSPQQCTTYINLIDTIAGNYKHHTFKSNYYNKEIADYIACQHNTLGNIEERLTLVRYSTGNKGIPNHLDIIRERNVTFVGIIYLNNCDGDTILTSDNITITPETGKLLLFDINMYHKAKPSSTNKYLLMFRIYDSKKISTKT
jgi:hypothetical protein